MEKNGISVACHNLRSAFNTGSILRTADAAGLEKVYLCGYTPFPPHDKLAKTSRGTHESVSWEHKEDIIELIHEQKKRGVHVIAIETGERAEPYYETEYPCPLLFVVGNEAHGLSDEILDICEKVVEIPMRGIKNSLNVAVAAGIVIYRASGM